MNNNLITDLFRTTYTPRYKPAQLERHLNTNVWRRGGLMTKNYSMALNRTFIYFFSKETVPRVSYLFLGLMMGIFVDFG